jgi:hypothetical protein
VKRDIPLIVVSLIIIAIAIASLANSSPIP